MATNITVKQFLSTGAHTFVMPTGFKSNVEVYVWGAGGGSGGGGAGSNGGRGGGGGYVKTNVVIQAGDTVTVAVGGAGKNAWATSGGAGGTEGLVGYDGGSGSTSTDSDGGGSGGGGAASVILINGTPVVVAAGGGGGGGLGDDWGGVGGAGGGGGSGTAFNSTTNGATGGRGCGCGGGGGGGYPYGGAGGGASGDDSGGGNGGQGGQNYVATSYPTTIIESGSGTTPGGASASYYRTSIGRAGYDGAIVMVFTKGFRAWLKQSGVWKFINNSYVKTPDRYLPGTEPQPSQRQDLTSTGSSLFTVPKDVTSINVVMIGGGGSGGDGAGADGSPHGGYAGSVTIQTISVTPGEVLSVHVGKGGSPVGYGSGSAGNAGEASTIKRGTSVLTSAAGGAGGARTGGGMDGEASSAPFSGVGGVAVWGGQGGAGGIGAGGAGVDGHANGYTSGAGGRGEIRLTYTPEPVPVIINAGGWKRIIRGWYKAGGAWKEITPRNEISPNSLAPTVGAGTTINISIAADTNNYTLKGQLLGLGYIPGQTTVTVTVEANVVVGSDSTTSPAMVIDGLTKGDIARVINYGYIVGAGGAGGNQGYNSTPGNPGGPALHLGFTTAIDNQGTIAGGGGGGGSWGVGNKYAGGDFIGGGGGGGGAGRTVGAAGSSTGGSGASNGTLTTGGAGGSGYGYYGGTGGNLGQAGGNGGGSGGTSAGGAAGNYIVNGSLAGWINTGTRLGNSA